MSTAEKLSPTTQSDFDSRPSMVRASLATACIARVISSLRRSALVANTARRMLVEVRLDVRLVLADHPHDGAGLLGRAPEDRRLRDT